MCNKLHREDMTGSYPAPIPSYGRGWKIFRKGFAYPVGVPIIGNEGLGSMMNGPYDHNPRAEWIRWKDRYTKGQQVVAVEEGFCFFMTLLEAERALRYWKAASSEYMREHDKELVICPISYRIGLGEINEYRFVGGKVIRMALCKMFLVG